jgi:hypothetical protein
MSNDLIRIQWKTNIAGQLLLTFGGATHQQIEVPMRFMEAVKQALTENSLHVVLPDSQVSRKLLSDNTLYFQIRGLLFFHKKFGIIQNPLDTPIPGFNRKVRETLETQYDVDSTLYNMIIKGGNSLREFLKCKGYPLQNYPTELDIFIASFSEEVGKFYVRLLKGKYGTNKANGISSIKSWSTFMTGYGTQINISKLHPEIINKIRLKNIELERREIEYHGIKGAIRIYVRGSLESDEKDEILPHFISHIKAERKLFHLGMQCPRIFNKDNVAYKARASNKHTKI